MSIKRIKEIVGWIAWVAVIVLAVNVVREPSRADRKPHQFPILSRWSLFPYSIAANLNQSYAPHGYADNSNVSGSGLSAGQTGTSSSMQLPSPADAALWCFTTFDVSIVNSTGATANPDFVPGGVSDNSINTPPMFPYIGTSHPGGTGWPCSIGGCGNPGIYFSIPSGGSAASSAYRGDGIIYNGQTTASPISSCSFSTPTVTCNATTATFATTCSGGACQGEYVQVFGSSVNGDNSQPGMGTTGSFPLTNVTSSSFSYADASGAACSSSCGSAYVPYVPGGPPYTTLAGFGGGTPAVVGYVEQPASGTNPISYSVIGSYACFPLTACATQSNDFSGCGVGNSFQ
jgi:hypothetical protein